MRSEFEKNRYWIGLYRSDVDFDESLGEFGRYVANGSRSFDAADLESFNEKWEAYANAYQHQQSKIDELTKQRDSFIKAYEIEMNKSDELQKRVGDLTQVMEELLEEMKYPTATFEEVICSGVRELEQALKGGGQ